MCSVTSTPPHLIKVNHMLYCDVLCCCTKSDCGTGVPILIKKAILICRLRSCFFSNIFCSHSQFELLWVDSEIMRIFHFECFNFHFIKCLIVIVMYCSKNYMKNNVYSAFEKPPVGFNFLYSVNSRPLDSSFDNFFICFFFLFSH